MKKLLVAAIVVLMASPAFAAIQNVKVSGDIQETYVDRNDFGLGTVSLFSHTPVGVSRQSDVLSQTRLRVDADLSDNVSATVRLINETAWGMAAGDNTYNGTNGLKGVDLDLAYVTLREFLYSPLTLTVGRQEFSFGNGLVIGAGGPNNGTSGHLAYVAGDLSEVDSYDGVKAVLDYKPLTLTAVYFNNGQNNFTGAYDGVNQKTNSDVYGLNANYQLGDAYNTVVEGYLFARINGSNTNSDTYIGKQGDKLYVPGLRASTNPIKGLNVQGEVAWQLGNRTVEGETVVNGAVTGVNGQYESEHRNAMAAQFLASYSLPVLEKYKPAVNAGFTYVSGDKNLNQNYSGDAVKSAKVDTAWDEFNKVQAGGTIYNALFPLTNMYIYSVGASAAPLEDVTAAFTWSDLIAADKFTPTNQLYLIQPNGSYALPVTSGKKNATGLGNEYDVNVNYAYTEDVSFGVNLGWFVSGSAFASQNRNTASQAIADVAVKF